MIPGYSNQPPFTFLPEANQDVVISLLLLYGIKFIANTTHTDNIIWNIGGYFEPFPQPTHYVMDCSKSIFNIFLTPHAYTVPKLHLDRW